jgi:hypothetical protein
MFASSRGRDTNFQCEARGRGEIDKSIQREFAELAPHQIVESWARDVEPGSRSLLRQASSFDMLDQAAEQFRARFHTGRFRWSVR